MATDYRFVPYYDRIVHNSDQWSLAKVFASPSKANISIHEELNACFRNTDYAIVSSPVFRTFMSYNAARYELATRLSILRARAGRTEGLVHIHVPIDFRLERLGTHIIHVTYEHVQNESNLIQSIYSLYLNDHVVVLDWDTSLIDFQFAISAENELRVDMDSLVDGFVQHPQPAMPTFHDQDPRMQQSMLFVLLFACNYWISSVKPFNFSAAITEHTPELAWNPMTGWCQVFEDHYRDKEDELVSQAKTLLHNYILDRYRQHYYTHVVFGGRDMNEYPPCFEHFPYEDTIQWFGARDVEASPPFHTMSMYGRMISDKEEEELLNEHGRHALIPFKHHEWIISNNMSREEVEKLVSHLWTDYFNKPGTSLDGRYMFRFMYSAKPTATQMVDILAEMYRTRETSLPKILHPVLEEAAGPNGEFLGRQENETAYMCVALFAFMASMMIDLDEYTLSRHVRIISAASKSFMKSTAHIASVLSMNMAVIELIVQSVQVELKRGLLQSILSYIQGCYIAHCHPHISSTEWNDIVKYRKESFQRLAKPYERPASMLSTNVPPALWSFQQLQHRYRSLIDTHNSSGLENMICERSPFGYSSSSASSSSSGQSIMFQRVDTELTKQQQDIDAMFSNFENMLQEINNN